MIVAEMRRTGQTCWDLVREQTRGVAASTLVANFRLEFLDDGKAMTEIRRTGWGWLWSFGTGYV